MDYLNYNKNNRDLSSTQQVEITQIFPSNLVRSKCPSITLDDKEDMIKSIDWMIENNMYHDLPLVPKYQTFTCLFRDEYFDQHNISSPHPIWKKLKETFYQSCRNYLTVVKNFCESQNTLQFTGTNAWAYKGWDSLDKTQSNPWHDHNPSFLSGVYYLHIPGDGTTGGTSFNDPRTPAAAASIHHDMLPVENTWVIFPGWLGHRSIQLPIEEPRYVVSANLFVKHV